MKHNNEDVTTTTTTTTTTAEVISLFERPKPEPWCSFCKAKKSEVKQLFSNGATGEYVRYICGGCVTLAAKKI